MVKSMTGFGKAVEEFKNKTITVEIRSLNSKQMDLNLRLYAQQKEKELELRTELSRLLERGKIDLSVIVEGRGNEAQLLLNKELALLYYQQLKEIATQIHEPNTSVLAHVLGMPDVIKNDKREIDEEEWEQVKSVINKAVAAIQKYREDEGRELEKAFQYHIKTIANNLKEIESLDKARIAGIKERIAKNLNEFIPADKIDQNRFEQEVIYYLEKLDITEEKIRLKTHCDYFLKAMKEESSGRKLNFISQEIGREINTIGSKANDAAIQKLVVEMKDELEKIKEQSMNVL